MNAKKINVISGVVIQSSHPLSLEELAQAINMQRDLIIDMVEHDLIKPEGCHPEEWQFDSLCLHRARIAADFYRDLDINLSGISLVLDLLDKIDQMQSRIELLERLLK